MFWDIVGARRSPRIVFEHAGETMTEEQNAELRELKRRNRLLEQENEVLRRAAAYLSQANLPGK